MILDLGGSYRWITKFLGGSYVSMKPDSSEGGKAPALQPFSLDPSERTYQFLTLWVQRLLALGGYVCGPSDLEDLRRRIHDIYHLPYDQRTLGALKQLLPVAMWPALWRHAGWRRSLPFRRF